MNNNLLKRSTGSKTSLLKSKSVSHRSPSKKSGSKSKSSSHPNRSPSKSSNHIKRELTLHGKPLIRPLQRAMHISAHGTIPLFKDPQRNFRNILSKKVPKNVHLWFYSTIGCKLANMDADPYQMMVSEINNYGVKNKLSAKFKNGSLLGQGETYVDTLLSLSPLHRKNIIDLGLYSIQIPDVGNGNNNNGAPIAVDTLPMTKLKKSGQVWLSTILNSPMVTSNAAKGPVLIVVDACRDINSPGAVKNANGVINRKNTIHKPLNQKTFFSKSKYPPSVIHNMQTYLITMLNNEVVQTNAYIKKHGYFF